jgi:acyl-CoA synthetase (AMP-forming)/AMP-acid ligase II
VTGLLADGRHDVVVLLADVLTAAAGDVGGRPAVVTDGRRMSFAQVAADVDALARAVSARTDPGDPVAILAPNCYAYLLAYYGVPHAGRVLLPLNQRLHPREWASQLARSGATMLIGAPDLVARLRAEAELPPAVRLLVTLDGLDELLASGAGEAPLSARPRPGDPAWLMYTSGTTGVPKGVLLTHRSLLAGARHSGVLRPLDAGDVFLTAFPMCHVAGYQIISAHLQRRPAVILARFDAAEFVTAVRNDGVTTCSLAPTMMDLLVDHLAGDPDAHALVRERLRAIGYGSAPMPPALIRKVLDALDCELNQGYGMTELSGNVTALGAAEHRAAIGGRPELLTSAGLPGPLARLAIMDEMGTLLPAGSAGEIVVRGEQVCAGYHNDPAATAAAFAHGWFHTGDLGTLDAEGRLTVVDRIKDIIVTGGENVASREVEDVLREQPGVREAAVVGLPDARWGERVCAVIVPTDVDAPPDPDALVATCRSRLAGFKTPRAITFVEALPRTASGKVRKDELRRILTANSSLTPAAVARAT